MRRIKGQDGGVLIAAAVAVAAVRMSNSNESRHERRDVLAEWKLIKLISLLNETGRFSERQVVKVVWR